ncbi:MAG: alkaline phosphatase D family protein, partial [Gaiellales bacterium]
MTREVVAGSVKGQLTVRTGTLASGSGFSGFVIGAGGGALDYRAAALVQSAGGTGGGLFCTYGSDGHVGFRDHGNEKAQLTWPPKTPSSSSGPSPARTLGEDVVLKLAINPAGPGVFTLVLTASDAATAAVLSTATLTGVAESQLLGGIGLVSSPTPGASGARFWFRSFAAAGSKISVRNDRSLGPIIAVLYSLNGTVLKLTAQLMPIGTQEPQTGQLQFRRVGTSAWTSGPSATVDSGYSLLFRIDTWDAAHAWEYQVVYGPGSTQQSTYGGTILRDPSGQPSIAVGIVNCTIHSFRPLDRASSGAPHLPGEHALGLYTANNLYFPYAQLAANLAKQQPDMLVSLGDQLYEHRPTITSNDPAPTLDYLYRYYLWLWAFGPLTRSRPTIVMVDDHDVAQGNLWGHDGAAAPHGDLQAGGYIKSPSFINMLQRIQTAHNPDAFDPTPVLQNISVYYGAFRYGGVSFAVLEDRKFKGGDADGLQATGTPYPTTTPLLGPRQEQFLASWASSDAGMPKVCLTQTLWGCLQTDENGAKVTDYDSDGYPPKARSRAAQLVRSAGAVIIAGDQHLGSLVRHGITGFGDGPIQFTAPAAGSAFQRWFEPPALLHPEATPHTGDFTDAFGNKMHVFAIANPRVTFKAFRAAYPGTQQHLGDPALKRDGYGLLRIDKTNKRYIIECWPSAVDPTASGA